MAKRGPNFVPIDEAKIQALSNNGGLSKETLKNISLLDLPAFGSTVGTLRKDLKKHFNWPVETNHAILTNNQGQNFTKIFASYKTLVEDWGHHMDLLGSKESSGHFTLQMANNRYMNFTKFIMADMKTFLMTISGNFSIFHFDYF